MARQSAENKKKADKVLGRRDASRDWLSKNFYDDFEDVWRSYKVRTEALTDEVTGEEDTSRTNVCMPDYWIIGRRKAARLSRRPPTLRIHSDDEEVSAFLSQWAAFQWDRSGEQRHQKRHVLQAELFGLSIKTHFWDKVTVNRRVRRTARQELEAMGVMVEEDEDGEQFRPATKAEKDKSRRFSDFDDKQQSSILASVGPEVMSTVPINKYEGPVSKFRFIGDVYMEPEFESIHTSAWMTFADIKDLEWLAYMAKQTYRHPITGEEGKVFADTDALEKLAKQGNRTMSMMDKDSEDLRKRFRDVIFKDQPSHDLKLIPGKRFHILEEHTFRDGWPWISWVANESIFLGEMPYPWDLYGNYAISAFTPIPDLLSGIGDSSPRALKFLMKLHNVTVAQRTDLLNQILKPLIMMREGADIPEEVTDRGLYRILRVADLNSYKFEQQPSIPSAAWESERQVMQMMQLGEPAMINFGGESQAVPNSQRTATLGLLQQKAQESLSGDELEQLNESLADETKIKVWMLQQTMQGEVGIPAHFLETLTSLQAGQGGTGPRKTKMDILELQEEFEVFPEMGSTLALDDIDRRREALEVYELASRGDADAQGPIWSIREAALRVAQTLKGRGSLNLLGKPQPPPEGPEPPKASINISIPWKDLEAEHKAEFLSRLGLTPSSQLQLKAVAENLEVTAQAGESLNKLATGTDTDTPDGTEPATPSS